MLLLQSDVYLTNILFSGGLHELQSWPEGADKTPGNSFKTTSA